MPVVRVKRLRILVAFAIPLLIVCLFWLASNPREILDKGQEAGSRFPDVSFTDVTEKAGIHFQHVNGATGRKLLPETMGSGVVVLDFDGDGRPDLFFVNSCPWPGFAQSPNTTTSALYRNNADGTFTDVTAEIGLTAELYGLGATAGDYDNDGFPDLFVTAIGGCRLFHNEATPTGRRFVDVTHSAGVGVPANWPDARGMDFLKWQRDVSFPASATWLDYDGDGRLDLFVCNYVGWSPAADLGTNAVLPNGVRSYVPPTQFAGTYCQLFRNIDGNRFEEVSASAGIHVSEPERGTGPVRPVGKALGVVVCDPDRDGWPDLLVANDTVRNFFFHNVPDGRGGRKYEEIGLLSGVAYADGRPRGGMGIDAAELRPGRLGVVVANFTNEPNTLMTLTKPDQLLFRDTADTEGLAGPSRALMKFGAFFFDYDHDGRNDLFTCNGHLEPEIASARPNQTHAQSAQLFWNCGQTDGPAYRLVPKTPTNQDLFRPIVGRGCAFLDFNGDGNLDIVVTENNGPARLYQNENRTGNHWVRFVLRGDGVRSNRDALGAEVELEAGGEVRQWYVTGSRGYLSQSELEITAGLGSTQTIDRVTVRWPGQAAVPQTWTGLLPNRVHRLTQGKPRAD